jgi:hypothetical protein
MVSILDLIIPCYATFDRGLTQAEKVGVRGVGSIKFICVPGEGSAFIYNKKKLFLTNENKIENEINLRPGW